MAIAFVQSVGNFADPGTSIVLSPAATVAGNLLVVTVNLDSTTATVSSITDGAGNTYTRRANIRNGAAQTELWSTAISGSLSATSITVTLSASVRAAARMGEYSGGSSLGVTATNSGNTTTPTISLTTQDNNNWVVAGHGTAGGVTYTAQTGNLRGQTRTTTAAGGATTDLCDNTSATPASVTNSVTKAGTTAWSACALEIRTVGGLIPVPDDSVYSQARDPDARRSGPFVLLADELAPQPFFPRMPFDEDYQWDKIFALSYAPQTMEQDLGLPPVVPTVVFDADLGKNFDVSNRQEDDPWHTFFLIPTPPPALGWDDWDWSKDYSTAYAKPPEGEPFDFPRPIVTPLAYDESAAFFPPGSGSLAAMVIMDEFVNAPSGSMTFGPAPSGRSVRFGFSISAFR